MELPQAAQRIISIHFFCNQAYYMTWCTDMWLDM